MKEFFFNKAASEWMTTTWRTATVKAQRESRLLPVRPGKMLYLILLCQGKVWLCKGLQHQIGLSAQIVVCTVKKNKPKIELVNAKEELKTSETEEVTTGFCCWHCHYYEKNSCNLRVVRSIWSMPSSMEELESRFFFPVLSKWNCFSKLKIKRYHRAIRKVNHLVFQLLVYLMDCLDENTDITQ